MRGGFDFFAFFIFIATSSDSPTFSNFLFFCRLRFAVVASELFEKRFWRGRHSLPSLLHFLLLLCSISKEIHNKQNNDDENG